MAKDEHKNEASNQLNLTVVALVALVAIVGLVALVMNAASVKTQIATGSQLASAEPSAAEIAQAQNLAGSATHTCADLRGIVVLDTGDNGECATVRCKAAQRLIAWDACD